MDTTMYSTSVHMLTGAQFSLLSLATNFLCGLYYVFSISVQPLIIQLLYKTMGQADQRYINIRVGHSPN